jgi:hypothetical protein
MSDGPRPTLSDVLDLLRRWASHDYGEPPVRLRVWLRSGAVVDLPVPRDTSHSADFRSVRWHGADYDLSPTQAAIMRQLWEAMEAGEPDVSGETLLEGAESESSRLPPLFQGHPAWGRLIVSRRRGMYRLAEDAPGTH